MKKLILFQILLNLISNSIKFTEKGQIIIRATGKISNSNLKFMISIVDTGIGIESQKLERLFDDKKKTESNDEDYIGGMGLSISKKLIDLLNKSW